MGAFSINLIEVNIYMIVAMTQHIIVFAAPRIQFPRLHQVRTDL